MNINHNIQYFKELNIDPNDNVGLARLEYIVSSCINIHPRALLDYGGLCLSPDIQAQIKPTIVNYAEPREYYIERLAEGIASIASCFYPEPLVLRMSDFKSTQYDSLIGGIHYQLNKGNKEQEASHYYSNEFAECFAMDCAAIQKVREEMAFTNIKLMLPFVHSKKEELGVLKAMKENGLKCGENGLEIILIRETPSNALLAEQFFEHCDCFHTTTKLLFNSQKIYPMN